MNFQISITCLYYPIVVVFCCHTLLLAQTGYWTKQRDPNVGRIYALAEASNGTIYAGTSRGVYYTTDDFQSWDSLNTGLVDTPVRALSIDNYSTIFAATSSGVFRRKGNDSVWSKLDVPGLSSDEYYTPFLMDSSYQLLLGSPQGIFRSTDRGDTWQAVNNGLSQSTFIYALASAGNGILYASTVDGLYQSKDNGQLWSRRFSFAPHTTLIALTSTARGTLLAAFGDGYAGSIQRSLDSGSTWLAVYSGGYVSNFSQNSSGHIFFGRRSGGSLFDGGVYRSTDDGSTWVALNAGLTYPDVTALIITRNGFAIIAMKDGTIFRSTQSTVTSIDEQREQLFQHFTFNQNYPNPFNSQTRFSFTIPERQLTSLTIFNSVGQEIETIFFGELNAGNYELTWSANTLSSGVYIGRLSSGRFTDLRKIILLK